MLRSYEEKDDKQLESILLQEGIYKTEMAYKQYDTFVIEEDGEIKGFFTVKHEHGYPSIQHFAVNRKFRSAEMARKLAKYMKETVKEMGYDRLILHSKSDILDKFISYYFKVKPYAFKDITTFFFVEV